MTLTSFIKIPEIEALFTKELPLSKTKLKGEMKANPVTKNYSLVGMSFDYLFRFFIEYTNPNCITNPWIAERSLANLERAIKKPGSRIPKSASNLLDGIISLMHDAKETHKEYLNTGKLDDSLMRTSIILAQMDVLYRIGKMPPDLGEVNQGDIQDLHNLISLVNPEMFRTKNTCYLNPTFGYGSELVGNADADLIIDDILIDIKTTKSLSFTRKQYNQLIGYYILTKLGKVNGKEDVSISKIGVYFSRFGVFHTISTNEIENNPRFPEFVKKFEKIASKVFNQNKGE